MSTPARILNQKHPSYDAAQIGVWEALYAGGKPWHDRPDDFLPKRPQEPADIYELRKKRAAYTNHAGPIIDMIMGWLFADAPTVDGAPPEWLADVDRRGTAFGDWWRALSVRAGVGRRAYAWLNLPAAASDVPASSLAEQEARGDLRTYLIPLDADEVINWSENEAGALASVMVHRKTTEQTDLLAPQITVHRWIYIDAVTVRRWEWTATPNKPDPGDEDLVTELPAIAHGFGALPVVCIGGACGLSPGLHVMGKLEDPVRALTGVETDLDWALHRGAHAMLVITADNAPTKPTTGPATYMIVEKGATVGFAEPGGACYAALEARIKARLESVYRVVQQMSQSASAESSKASTSGASKAMDWQALAIMLESYASVVRGAMSQILALAAVVWGVDAEAVTVAGLGGWSEEDLSQKLADLALAMPVVKSETFRKEVAKRTAHAMLDDATPEQLAKIDAEVDAADYSDEAIFPAGQPMPDPAADPNAA